MDVAAVAKAKGRLRIAAQAIKDLEECATFQEFSDTWYIFLMSWNGVFNCLEQGSKASATSRQWFARKKAARKGDPLLSYIFQARHDDEHGISRVLDESSGSLIFEVPDVGVEGRQLSTLIDRRNGTLDITVTRPDGGPIRLVHIQNPGIALRHVTARGGIIHAPPITHLGNPLSDLSPLSVGRLALAFATAVAAEAEAISKPSP